MYELVTSPSDTSYALASSTATCSTCALLSSAVCTRTVLEPTEVTRGTSSGATAATASSAGCCEVSETPETVNSDPPRNSMPRLSPSPAIRTPMMPRDRTTRTSATTK